MSIAYLKSVIKSKEFKDIIKNCISETLVEGDLVDAKKFINKKPVVQEQAQTEATKTTEDNASKIIFEGKEIDQKHFDKFISDVKKLEDKHKKEVENLQNKNNNLVEQIKKLAEKSKKK